MKTLQDLMARAATLANHHTNLRALLDRQQAAGALAAKKIGELDRTEAFRLAPQDHKDKVQGAVEQQVRQAATMAAGFDVYSIETAAPVLLQETARLKAETRRAPDALTGYLQRSGGSRLNLTTGDELQIQMLDELRQARYLTEYKQRSVAETLQAYQRALDDDSDESQSLVRFIEAHGFTGTPPGSTEEITEAARLRRMIDEAQAARVPGELADIEATIDAANRLANKARELYGIVPVDPAKDPAVLGTHREQLEALAADVEGQPA